MKKKTKKRILNGRATTYFSMHNHSHFSFLDGFSEPEEYLRRSVELGLEGFAISEHGNAYSWVYFDKAKEEYAETKMVYGVEFYETGDTSIRDKDNRYYHLLVLAKNENGRKALNRLVSDSNLEENFYYKPRTTIEKVAEHGEDLIVSSACLASKLSRNKDESDCISFINEYKEMFPHFYLELQSHYSKDQQEYNKKLIKLSEKTNTPFVITTDSHASSKEELEYQHYHVQVAKDIETAGEIYEGCYVQSVEEIYECLTSQIGEENVTKGLLETLNILDMIEVVDMPFQEPKLPTFDCGDMTENEKMKEIIAQGWIDRGVYKKTEEEQEVYRDRINYEMSVISKMNYEGYFLIIEDFISYAKENEVEIGDGRGSAGGSLVSFLMGITNIDPITYGLVFERFLNPERIGLPDIDVDVSNQQTVVDYLEQKYGAESVCRVSNFSYITPKVAIKDVARVLGVPYAISESVSKYFVSNNFEEDFNLNKESISPHIEKYPKWIEVASKIAGKVRQASIHACAVGIVNEKVVDYMPMHRGANDERVIQVDKKMLEKIGIVKMDILGVKTLSVVKDTLDLIGRDNTYIDINNEEFLKDEKTYELLSSGKTYGVFQISSYGMRDLFQKLKCQNIDNISAGISLYRPDAMSLLDEYIEVKDGVREAKYLHDDMIPILEPQYGCMIYQEQLLEVVKKFGGRTYGQADIFRKGIGAKDKELVEEESEKLRNEIAENGYNTLLAGKISNYLSSLGNYLFNKSHGVGYATLTYKTAFLKANHPVEYMTALLNSEEGKFEKIAKVIADCKNIGVRVIPPKINQSKENFSIDGKDIVFGISMIKGVGEKAVANILGERSKAKFTSYDNFISRMTTGENKITRGSIIPLIKAGSLGNKKSQLFEQYMNTIFEKREYTPVKSLPTLKVLKENYGIEEDDKSKRLVSYNIEREKEFNLAQEKKVEKEKEKFRETYLKNKVKWEFETLSMYLTRNPFKKALEIITPIADCENGEKVTMVGTVIDIDKKNNGNGQYAFMDFYNGEEKLELIFWNNTYSKYRSKISKGTDIAVIGFLDGEKITVESAKPYHVWCKEKGLI